MEVSLEVSLVENLKKGPNCTLESFLQSQIMKDPGTDRIFYFHKKNGTSQWELPSGAFVPPSVAFADSQDEDEHDDAMSVPSEVGFAYNGPQIVRSQQHHVQKHANLLDHRMGNRGHHIHENINTDETGADDDEDSWVEVWDEETNRKFWHHEMTGESRWVRPGKPERRQSNVIAASELNILQRPRQSSIGSVLDEEGDWRMMKDNVTGRVFFYNVSSGHSQWERPEEFDGPNLLAGKLYTPAEKWEKLHDPATGRVFFFNREEGITQWERPRELDFFPREGSPRICVIPHGLHPTDDGEEEQEGDWEEIYDPDSKRVFYFNRRTGRSSWDRPSLKGNSPSGHHAQDSTSQSPVTPPVANGNGEEWKGDTEDAPASSTDDIVQATYIRAPRRASGAPAKLSDVSKRTREESGQGMSTLTSPPKNLDKATETENDPHIFSPAPPSFDDASHNEAFNPAISSKPDVTEKEDGTPNQSLGEAAESKSSRLAKRDTEESLNSEIQDKKSNARQQDPESTDSLNAQTDWRELIDESTGRTYFFNQVTGESQWIDPRKATLVDEDWCQLVDAETQRKYFYNKRTGESRWHLDEKLNADTSAPLTDDGDQAVAEEDQTENVKPQSHTFESSERRLDRSETDPETESVQKDAGRRSSAMPSLASPTGSQQHNEQSSFSSASSPTAAALSPQDSNADPAIFVSADHPTQRGSAPGSPPSAEPTPSQGSSNSRRASTSPGFSPSSSSSLQSQTDGLNDPRFQSERKLDRAETFDHSSKLGDEGQQGISAQRRTSAMPNLGGGYFGSYGADSDDHSFPGEVSIEGHAQKLREVDPEMFTSSGRRLDRSETLEARSSGYTSDSGEVGPRRASAMPTAPFYHQGEQVLEDCQDASEEFNSSTSLTNDQLRQIDGDMFDKQGRRLDRSETFDNTSPRNQQLGGSRRLSAMPRLAGAKNSSSVHDEIPEDQRSLQSQSSFRQGFLEKELQSVDLQDRRDIEQSMFDSGRRLDRSESADPHTQHGSESVNRRTSAMASLAGGYLQHEGEFADEDASRQGSSETASQYSIYSNADRVAHGTTPSCSKSQDGSPSMAGSMKTRRASAMPDLNVGSMRSGSISSDGDSQADSNSERRASAVPGLMANYLSGFRNNDKGTLNNGVQSSQNGVSTQQSTQPSRRRSSLMSFSPFIGSIAEASNEEDEYDEDDAVAEKGSMSPPSYPPPHGTSKSRVSTIPDEFRPENVFSGANLLFGRHPASTSPTSKDEGQEHEIKQGQHGHLPGPISIPSDGPNADANGFQIPALRSASSPQQHPMQQKLNHNDGSDPMANASVRALAPLRGYLEKRARHGRQQWQKRYFTLDDRNLRYFESERQATNKSRDSGQLALARIDLNKVSHVESEDGDDGFQFGVYGRGALGVLVLLRSETAHERELWLAALRARIVKDPTPALKTQHAQNGGEQIFARCIETVSSSEPGMLRISRGDTIRVLQKSDGDRWWIGEVKGRIGNFLPEKVVLISSQEAMNGGAGSAQRPSYESSPEFGSISSRMSARMSSTSDNEGLRTELNRVERRIEARQKRDDLEALLNSLGVEPMKSPEEYPTESYIRYMQERLKDLNVRNHKLLAEVRSLEWKLDHQDPGPAAPNAYLLVSYSKLLTYMRSNPRLLVQVGASLEKHEQSSFSGIVADALFDEYSVDEQAFEDLVELAVDMLWDQGLPTLDNMRRRDANLDTEDEFLPSLLASFVRRTEPRRYLDKILGSIKEDFVSTLTNMGETRVKVMELACLFMDVIASDAGLDMIPQCICNVGAMLFDIGGVSILHRFLFETIFVPPLFWPGFLPGKESLGDPALFRRMRMRLDGLVEFLCEELSQDQSGSTQPSNARRLLTRLTSKLVRKIVDGAGPSATHKPVELCDLVVVSCEDLYVLQASINHWARKFRAPEPLLEILSQIGDSSSVTPASANAQPYLVLRLSPVGPETSMTAATPLEKETLRLLIKARSKIDSSRDSWNAQRDGELLDQLESKLEGAKQAMAGQRRIQFGADVAERYTSKLEQEREHLLYKLESRRALTSGNTRPGLPMHTNNYPKSYRAAGLVPSLMDQSYISDGKQSSILSITDDDDVPARPLRQAPPSHYSNFTLDEVDEVEGFGFNNNYDLQESEKREDDDVDDEWITDSMYGHKEFTSSPTKNRHDSHSEHLGDLLSTVFSPFDL